MTVQCVLKIEEIGSGFTYVMIFLSIHGLSLVHNELNEVICLQFGVKVLVLGIVELGVHQIISILLEFDSLAGT